MDVMVQYFGETGTRYDKWLAYTSGALSSDKWTTGTFTSDVFEPGILNQGESVQILIRVNPVVGRVTTNRAIIGTEKGVTVSTYFAGDSEEETSALGLCVRAFADLAEHDIDGRPVPYRAVHGLAALALEGLTSGRGSYLAAGVTVGSLSAVRTLPFAAVFVCGLGEGLFPASDPTDPLDLRISALGDRSEEDADVFLREQDKYQFLELLSCVRERIHMSYVSRDALTGSFVEPSSVVTELHYALHRDHTLHPDDPVPCPLVQRFPLRRYDRAHFPRDDAQPGVRLVSHDPEARREANAVLLGEAYRRTVGAGTLPDKEALGLGPELVEFLALPELPEPAARGNEVVPVSINAIRAFLECPLQGWAKKVLGLDEEEDDDEPARWDEVLATPPKDRSVLLRNVFTTALESWDPASGKPDFFGPYRRAIERAELRGQVPTGRYLEREEPDHLQILEGWFANSEHLGLLVDGAGRKRSLDPIRFGRAEEHERVAPPRDPIRITVAPPEDLCGRDPVTVELYGRTQILAGVERISVIPVCRSPRDGDHLRGFVDALFLALGGLSSGRVHEVCVVQKDPIEVPEPGKKGKRSSGPPGRKLLSGIDHDQAKAYLVRLLSEMLYKPHPYLFPHEAALAYLAEPGKKLLIERIEELRQGRGSFSSTYGPMPHPREYGSPASEEEAQRLLENRFGLYHRAQARGEERA
jgi:exodeoxyribonuclease V gamma subunit